MARIVIDDPGSAGFQRVLVTGANGFVGRALCRQLAARGVEVTALVRSPCDIAGARHVHAVGDFTAVTEWRPWLTGLDAIAHLAALTHDGTRGASAADFHALNVDVSRHLAEAAVESGIRRFVYLSSIKVNGESSRRERGVIHACSAADVPAPEDDYGRSKLEAEQALRALWSRVDGALTVLRPPLVYGPGQKGNLPRLMALVARGVPLPFAALDNRRSLIHVDNLASAIVRALGIGSAGQRCYTLADVDVSSAELVRAIAQGLGVAARLVSVPGVLLDALAWLPVVGPRLRRLTGSLLVDARAIENDLGWYPSLPFEQAMAATCAAWRDARP